VDPKAIIYKFVTLALWKLVEKLGIKMYQNSFRPKESFVKSIPGVLLLLGRLRLGHAHCGVGRRHGCLRRRRQLGRLRVTPLRIVHALDEPSGRELK
jgi:hypothetical protein